MLCSYALVEMQWYLTLFTKNAYKKFGSAKFLCSQNWSFIPLKYYVYIVLLEFWRSWFQYDRLQCINTYARSSWYSLHLNIIPNRETWTNKQNVYKRRCHVTFQIVLSFRAKTTYRQQETPFNHFGRVTTLINNDNTNYNSCKPNL